MRLLKNCIPMRALSAFSRILFSHVMYELIRHKEPTNSIIYQRYIEVRVTFYDLHTSTLRQLLQSENIPLAGSGSIRTTEQNRTKDFFFYFSKGCGVGIQFDSVQNEKCNVPVSILYKSIAGRYRPVRVADGPITTRYRCIRNTTWGPSSPQQRLQRNFI